MRISMEQLPSVSSARRDELLVAIETLARGFAHLIRGHMKKKLVFNRVKVMIS
jgi:hypothetical protein